MKHVHLEYLSAVKAGTKAFIETRKTLSLTPAELNLLGLRQAPEVLHSTVVLLKCGYRSRINDKRRDYGLAPVEPTNNDLPWGEWEIEDAVIRLQDGSNTRRYLRYYNDPDPHDSDTHYFDPVTGYEITGLKRSDIERLLRRRNQRNTGIVHITDIDNITELTTLDNEMEPDIDIISTLQD